MKNKIVKNLFANNIGVETKKIINKNGKNNSNLCFIKFSIEISLKNDFSFSIKFIAVNPLAYLCIIYPLKPLSL